LGQLGETLGGSVDRRYSESLAEQSQHQLAADTAGSTRNNRHALLFAHPLLPSLWATTLRQWDRAAQGDLHPPPRRQMLRGEDQASRDNLGSRSSGRLRLPILRAKHDKRRPGMERLSGKGYAPEATACCRSARLLAATGAQLPQIGGTAFGLTSSGQGQA
jgi:hypothetical protein